MRRLAGLGEHVASRCCHVAPGFCFFGDDVCEAFVGVLFNVVCYILGEDEILHTGSGRKQKEGSVGRLSGGELQNSS